LLPFYFCLMSVAERVGVLRDLLHHACARAESDDGDAREDERGGDPGARAPLLVGPEDERREGEGDEWLQVYVDGDRARRDSFERPSVQVVSADRRDEDDVCDGEPRQPAEVFQWDLREMVAADGHCRQTAEGED